MPPIAQASAESHGSVGKLTEHHILTPGVHPGYRRIQR